jgi:uncharacterized protein (TIGR00369 family)
MDATANEDFDAKVRSGRALMEAMGDFHVLSWDPQTRSLRAGFTVRREFCHTNGTTAQGGFVTAWLDAGMAHAVMHDSGHQLNVASLEIKVSFLQRMGPGPGTVEARVVRRGKRVAFMEAELFDSEGRMTARASSTGLMTELIR